MPMSETQKGAIVENLVANWLMSCSEGRLSPFKPVADDGGIDLLVFDHETRKTLLIQVKGRTYTDVMQEKDRKVVRLTVRTATFEVRDDFYILGVLVSSDLQTPKVFWLIPSKYFEQEAVRARKNEGGNHTRLDAVCSFSDNSHDKWAQFRTLGPSELVKMVHAELQK